MRPVTRVETRFASPTELVAVLAERFWERAPVLFRGHGLGDPFGGEDAIAAGLRADRTPPRLYVDGARRMPAPEDRCGASDPTLAAYLARLSDRHGTADLAVVTDRSEGDDPRIWSRCCGFLQALYGAVGVAPGGASVNTFVGTYRRTPFGFHKDVSNTLVHAVAGRKRYLLWDYASIAARLPVPADARHENVRFERFDYHELDSIAIVADMEPGDLLYWPWDWFHVGEPGQGELTVSQTLGTFPFASPLAALEGVERLARVAPAAFRTVPAASGAVADPADEVAESVRLVLEDPVVRAELRDRRLARLSRFGFAEPPPEAPPLRRADDVRLVASVPGALLWHVDGERCLVAAHGRTLTLDHDPAVIELLEAVSGGAWTLGALRRRFAEAIDPDDLDLLVDCLVRYHALREERAPASLRPPPDLFLRSGLFPVGFEQDGAVVRLIAMRDEDHRRIEGFDAPVVRVDVDALLAAPRAPTSPRWIFTAGYSGSTLLCRFVEALPGGFAIHEPAILTEWARAAASRSGAARERWFEVLRAVVALLFRVEGPWPPPANGARTSDPVAVGGAAAGAPASDPGVRRRVAASGEGPWPPPANGARTTDPVPVGGAAAPGVRRRVTASWEGPGRPVVKVGPGVSPFVAELLALGGRAVHLRASLPAFLANILHDPHRREDLRAEARDPNRAAATGRIGATGIRVEALSDARAAAWVWLGDGELARRCGSPPLAVDFDGLLGAPEPSLLAVAGALDLGADDATVAEVVRAGLLDRHAKPGRGAYRAEDRAAALAERRWAHEAAIADAVAWAVDVADAFGWAAPPSVAHPAAERRVEGTC